MTRLIDIDNFSNEFNTKIFNKLQNEYLNSTADDKTKDVADFVTTDIMTAFNDLIDNAPTVEYTFEEAFQKTICEQRLYCPERPQGEWIFQYTFLDDNLYKCSSCNRFLSIDIKQDIKQFLFCPNCGADMRKGGAE